MRKTQRGRSHLVPRLDGQNMIPRSPEERDSQRFCGNRIEDWQAEAAVLNDFQVKRKETKVSLFLVLPLTAKYIWIGRSVEPCWLERRRAGRWGEDREGPEGHLAPSSCSAQWRQVVRHGLYTRRRTIRDGRNATKSGWFSKKDWTTKAIGRMDQPIILTALEYIKT